RLAIYIAAGHPVTECIDARDAAIRIEIAELRRLLETHAVAVIGCACRELVAVAARRAEPCYLTGHAIVALLRAREIQYSVAFLSRLGSEQSLPDAAPEWEWRVRVGGATCRKSCVACCGQRRTFGSAWLIHRLIERVFVNIAVECIRAEIAKIGITGKY